MHERVLANIHVQVHMLTWTQPCSLPHPFASPCVWCGLKRTLFKEIVLWLWSRTVSHSLSAASSFIYWQAWEGNRPVWNSPHICCLPCVVPVNLRSLSSRCYCFLWHMSITNLHLLTEPCSHGSNSSALNLRGEMFCCHSSNLSNMI